jgi:hypothetical protein
VKQDLTTGIYRHMFVCTGSLVTNMKERGGDTGETVLGRLRL